MFLLEMIYRFSQGDNDVLLIMSDWLEEHYPNHLELETYLKRLRSGCVTYSTIFDIGMKFGTKKERYFFSKIKRRHPKYNSTVNIKKSKWNSHYHAVFGYLFKRELKTYV